MTKSKIIVISLIISFIALFLSLYPNWYALKHVPAGYVFSGQASWFDPWDLNVYVAAVHWGQHHGFLLENIYTSLPNPKIVYYPLYTLAGALVPSANPFLVFYGFSVFSTFFLVLVLTFIIQKLIRGFLPVLITVASIIFAGGLGFLVFPFLNSLDTTMTAATFHSAIQRPHEGIALACYILALMAFYFSTETKTTKWKLASVFSLMLTLALYPYYILSFFAIAGLYIHWKFGWNWLPKHRQYASSLGLGAFGTVWLQYLNLHSNSSLSGVIGQQLSSPAVIPFVFSYGLLAIPFIFQLVKMRPITPIRFFLSIWIFVSLVFMFLPIGIARFYLRGIFFPLVILAVLVIKYLLQKYFPANLEKKLVIVLVYLFICVVPTTLTIFFRRINETTKTNQWFYMTKNQYDALLFMGSTFPKQSAILSDYYLGNLIPAFTDQRVYFGHFIQTPDVSNKQKQLTQFYAGEMNQDQVEQFLKVNKITYVYWGTEEVKRSAAHGKVSQFPYHFLREVYKNPSVSIFQLP